MVITKKIKTPWYIGGLHFECRKCGRCCSGPQEGVIWISRPEIQMLAGKLGLSVSQLRKNHLKRIGFRCSIKEDPRSKDCIFLTDKGCTIYDVRPMQCRAWPFWPANLQSPDDWNAAATKCPGINKGRLYSFDEIQTIKKQKQWWSLAPAGTAAQSRDSNGAVNLKICNEVSQIYIWLDENLKPFNNSCSACGKCCDFDSFGHKLFVTTPELLYFRQNAVISSEGPLGTGAEKSIKKQICPYLENDKCNARNYRFAGCRIFFCKANKDLQNKLSEETVKKFKSLCDKFDFPYRYVDLMTALNMK